MPIDLEQSHINPEDPQFQPMLANLQCNILKSHGRDYAVHIFLKFTAQPDDVKTWIIASNYEKVNIIKEISDERYTKKFTM